MKAIKIILGSIIALVVVFFATGLIVKETKYTAEVEINKPIDQVFALFENKDKMKEWLPDIKSIEPIEIKEGKIGSVYKITVKNKEQTIIMKEKIMAYVPNQKMTFLFDSDDMIKKDDYNFIAEGSKTKMIQKSSVQSKSYIMSCVFPWFKTTFKNLSLDYMNKFKDLAEK